MTELAFLCKDLHNLQLYLLLTGARVAFVAAALKPEPAIAISRAGKQPSEDPSVGVIKNIIK